MANAGYKAESTLLEEITSRGSAVFKNLHGDTVEIPVSGSVLTFGFSTRTKVDMVINGKYALQVKCSGSKRSAIINMVPARLLEKCGNEQLLDVSSCYKAMEIISSNSGKIIKLSEYFDIEDWSEILSYFLFEGTATGQSSFKANYLLEVNNGSYTLIDKKEAVPHLWEGLTAEIRTRPNKTEPCLHVRYAG